jgi:branched-chain amino acid transport system permease protein
MNWELIFWNALYAAIGANAAGYCLVAMGLNVHVGYTGLLNFGQAGFAAVGAYAFAIPVAEFDWPWYTSLPLVFFGSILLALLLGLPTLRLRADYLAIVTIAAAEIIRFFLASSRFTWLTGGTDGKNGWTGFFSDLNFLFEDSRRYNMGSQPIDGYRLFMLLLGWAVVILVAVLVWALMRSPWGRVLKSIREDEDAARSLGKNVVFFKMQSLILGGLIGSLGGLVISATKQSAQQGEFSTTLTFFAFTIIVLGGIGRVKGPIIGTMIFFFVIQFVDNVLQQATERGKVPDWALVDSTNFGRVKFVIAGLALALLVVFRPQGIFGDKREQVFDVR